jgi:hypothetical protein
LGGGRRGRRASGRKRHGADQQRGEHEADGVAHVCPLGCGANVFFDLAVSGCRSRIGPLHGANWGETRISRGLIESGAPRDGIDREGRMEDADLPSGRIDPPGVRGSAIRNVEGGDAGCPRFCSLWSVVRGSRETPRPRGRDVLPPARRRPTGHCRCPPCGGDRGSISQVRRPANVIARFLQQASRKRLRSLAGLLRPAPQSGRIRSLVRAAVTR